MGKKKPAGAIDVGEVMRTPEMREALTKEIDGEIIDALHVAAKDKPLEVEKHYLTVIKAVYCRKLGCGLVDIHTVCRLCSKYAGIVYRANGTDMDVVCFEDSKQKAWDNIPGIKKTKGNKK